MSDFEIEYLKKTQDGPLNVAVLGALKELKSQFNKKIDVPYPFKTVLENWNKFRIMGISAVVENKYPSLTKAWKHLHASYGDDSFDESIIDAWCFSNFQVEQDRSFAEIYLNDKENPEALKGFVKKMAVSRLGFYETVLKSKETMRLKEIMTGEVFDVHNSIDSMLFENELYLARLFPVEDKHMLFGSPAAFPLDCKAGLKSMIESKMCLYYEGEENAYESHMKLSGPYWVSFLSENKESEILDADFYQEYYREDFRINFLPQWMSVPVNREQAKKKQEQTAKIKKDKRKASRKARKRNR